MDQSPFAELPAALVDEVLNHTEEIGRRLLAEFEGVRSHRHQWREAMTGRGWIRRDAELPYCPIPTTCGVDGSYAIERLLANDLVAAAAVAVEGLTPPSETRHWPEPRHLAVVDAEGRDASTATILRAVMIGMELELAAKAPHEVVLLDGSLTTPLIYLNQALNAVATAGPLHVAERLVQRAPAWLEDYRTILASRRTDRCWVAVPKYTSRHEIGDQVGWPRSHDDRSILSFLLDPGEFTQPIPLERPAEPWHLNVAPLPEQTRQATQKIAAEVTQLLLEVRVVYYRPSPWLPALRLETSPAVCSNEARLATALHGVRHQCGTPGVLEPYPLHMADRMVKQLHRAIPSFRQVASQKLAETYKGNLSDVFLGMHGYRTESGV